MKKQRILVTGACGQIGTELVKTLREFYGNDAVIATDIYTEPPQKQSGPYEPLNVCGPGDLETIIKRWEITEVYHLAAMLSARGEQQPLQAWALNMEGLLNVLEAARKKPGTRIFWPSSIAVFGPDAPKINCPQHTVLNPSTIYGISKQAGEQWCDYYRAHYQVDVRSLRFPGLISHSASPGGGTTDYAVEIFYAAMERQAYNCFLTEDTRLPMLYMPDAIRAIIQLMEAPEALLSCASYNLGGLDFTPAELALAIRAQIRDFRVSYTPDQRQQIADSWPSSIDDAPARHDWDWKPQYGLEDMVADMIRHLHDPKVTTA